MIICNNLFNNNIFTFICSNSIYNSFCSIERKSVYAQSVIYLYRFSKNIQDIYTYLFPFNSAVIFWLLTMNYTISDVTFHTNWQDNVLLWPCARCKKYKLHVYILRTCHIMSWLILIILKLFHLFCFLF